MRDDYMSAESRQYQKIQICQHRYSSRSFVPLSLAHMNSRLLQYYRNHVLVHCRISPSPSSAAEVQNLYENFKTLGNLEFFKVPRDNTVSRFSGHCIALFNPALAESPVTPFTIPEQGFLPPKEAISTQSALVDTLQSIIAIPRQSYIAGDSVFLANKSQIPFRYSLSANGLQYENKFNITSSKFADQFCYVSNSTRSNQADIRRFRKEIRHNFQKFHKFSSIRVELGIDAVNSLGATINDSVTVEDDLKDILNLSPPP